MVEGPTRQVDIETVVDLADIITSLRELSDDELAERGLAVEGMWDEIDDPVLLGPHGTPVDTWREDYPYDERFSRHEYEREKRLLQIELLKLQSWVKDTGQRVVILFEGRDAAGKGSAVSGTSSAMSSTCRARARSSSSTVPGTTVPSSSA
jgi:hypothetical protein